MTAARLFQFMLVTISMGLWSACSTVPTSFRNHQQLQSEFESTVGSASEEFARTTRNAHRRLIQHVDLQFDAIQTAFVDQCITADGVAKRFKADASLRKEIETSLSLDITRVLEHSINEFITAYTNALDLLEERLLVETELRRWPDEVAKHYAPIIARYSPEVDLISIRGSSILKIADEAAGFVPFAGDAWDFYKLLISDPREKAIRRRAEEFFRGERDRLQTTLQTLGEELPSAASVETTCRGAFKVESAFKRLEES